MSNITYKTKMWRKLLRHIFLELMDRLLQRLEASTEKPWMRYREIEIIEDILKNLRPKKCLEWGAGYSTLYFPKILDNDSIWISIEHDREWASRISKKVIKSNLNNVKVFLVPPNKYPWSDVYKDGDFYDLKDYIEFPKEFGGFDFILIDGGALKHCLIMAYDLLRSNGVVVLHDANRRHYYEPFKLYKHQVLITDYRKDAGGLWIGSRELDINQVINLEKHLKLFKMIDKVGRLIRRGI